MEPTTACCGIGISMNTFSWTHSLPPARGEVHSWQHVLPTFCYGQGVPICGAKQAIKQFTKEIGAPDAIVSDMAKEQLPQEVKHFCNLIGTTRRALVEGTPWSNPAELYIKLMKEAVCKDMQEMDSPMVLWDYCLECQVRIYNLMAWDHFKVCGTNPHTATTGEEGDISNVSTYDGMNGATTESTPTASHIIKKFWDKYWGLHKGRAMRWPSGSLRQMGT